MVITSDGRSVAHFEEGVGLRAKCAGWDRALQGGEVKLEKSSGVVGDVGPAGTPALLIAANLQPA